MRSKMIGVKYQDFSRSIMRDSGLNSKRHRKLPISAVITESVSRCGAVLRALAHESWIKHFLNSLPKSCVSKGVTLILMSRRKIVFLSATVKNQLYGARLIVHSSDRYLILRTAMHPAFRLLANCFRCSLLLVLFICFEVLAQGARSIEGCNIRRGTFCVDMNLYGSDLQNENLANSQFTRSILSKANLTGANLNEANLSSTQLREANLNQASLVKTNARGARFNDAQLVKANLQGAILQNADLSGANLTGAMLTNADLTNAKLGNAILDNADIQRANMRATHLRGASLVNANLQGVNFTGADLTDADLSGANLDQTIFNMTRTSGCKNCP